MSSSMSHSSSNSQLPGFVFLMTMIMMSATGLFATDIYLPALPEMSRFFNCSQTEIQASFTVFLLGLAGCQLVYGILADRFGHKRILLFGLTLFIFASILCALSVSLSQFISFRLLQALGGGAGSVICRTIISQRYSRTDTVKIFSTIFPVIGLSAAIAPLIGGYLTYFFHWRSTFYFMALFGVVAMGLVITHLKDSPKRKLSRLPNVDNEHENKTVNGTKKLSRISGYLGVLKNLKFLGYAFILCSGFAVFRCYTVESPFVFDNQGYMAEEMGQFYIALSLAYLAGNLWAKRLVNFLSVEQVIRRGFIFSVVGGILMVFGAFCFGTSPYAVILPMAVITLGNGFLFPTSSAGAMASVPAQFSGMASGLMGSLQFVVAAFCVHWVGEVCHGQAEIMSMYIGAVIFIGLLNFVFFVSRPKGPVAELN